MAFESLPPGESRIIPFPEKKSPFDPDVLINLQQQVTQKVTETQGTLSRLIEKNTQIEVELVRRIPSVGGAYVQP